MKSYHLEDFNKVSGPVIREHAVPTPTASEVLIRIRAASLNRRDWYILQQTYLLAAPQEVIPLSDGAGEVVAAGEKVTRFRVRVDPFEKA